MNQIEHPDLILLVRSTCKGEPSTQQDNGAPMTAFTEKTLLGAMNTIVCTATCSSLSTSMLCQEQRDRDKISIEFLQTFHSVLQNLIDL